MRHLDGVPVRRERSEDGTELICMICDRCIHAHTSIEWSECVLKAMEERNNG